MLGDLISIEGLVDPATCSRIVAEMDAGQTAAAPVYGASATGTIDQRVRRASRVTVAPVLHEAITSKVLSIKERLEQHFRVPDTVLEPLQFLRYGPGDHFVAHQDGNTSLIYDDTLLRRFSIVVFLNDGSEYDGGSLMLHGAYPNYDDRLTVPSSVGRLVAFRSETTHEVTPVERGRRYTAVSWFRVGSAHSTK